MSAITVPASRKPSAKESLNVSTERKERKQFRAPALGLAIVRRVAELHGGKPSISEGIEGKGQSALAFDFPICKAAVENQSSAEDE